MPQFGLPELIIIFVIILLIFGAKRLPELGKALGKTISSFKEGVKESEPEKKPEEKKEG